MRFSLQLILASLLLFVFQFHVSAQNSKTFSAEGDSAYTEKNYPVAIKYYLQSVQQQNYSFIKKNDYYNIACCYALMKDKLSTWKYLNIALTAGYNDYAHIVIDSDLEILHKDQDWQKFPALNKMLLERISDPAKAKLVTSDIHNFWNAFDKVQKDTAHAAEIYTKYYFDEASPGLQDYFALKIFSIENFVANQKKKPAFYKAIRKNTLKVDQFKQQIQQSFVKLKALYNQAIFPNVYFVIGRWNSAGTVSNNGLLIGIDMMSKSDDVPLGELNLWEKNNYKSIDNLPYIVAHELIHSQQSDLKNDTTTLSACIREGMADFLGEMISGKTLMKDYWYSQREKRNKYGKNLKRI